MTQQNMLQKEAEQMRQMSPEEFCTSLPYKHLPYSKRNWGHPLHSLCSYQGKLKPAQAHWLIKEFSASSDVVLDPLGGVGTIGFEASMQGRQSVSSDLSPFASVIASGKLSPPSLSEAESCFSEFWDKVSQTKISRSDWDSASFGLNSAVADYYHPDTLEEVLRIRRYFLDNQAPIIETFYKACCLHVLHGNRPYALSRTSHPITPFAPKGEFLYKSVSVKIQDRYRRVLNTPLSEEFRPGVSFKSDFRTLTTKGVTADVIITSPPFIGMRFDRPNWLRMWFCGWEENDFHETSKNFLERQQTVSLDVYNEFFDVCAAVSKPKSMLILHLGKSHKYDMVTKITALAQELYEPVYIGDEDVTDVSKHGIGDKGQTKQNSLLFLRKRN